MAIASDEQGEILEQPQASEVYEKLEEPISGAPVESDKVRKWKSRIEAARKIRDEKLGFLNRLIQYYEGIQWHLDDDFTVLKDKTTINMIFANIKEELPGLYFQNPSPIVNPKERQYELSAFAMQELLRNYVKYNNRTELKKHIRLCILDAKFIYGCAKVTYTPRFGNNPKAGKPVVAGIDDFGQPIFVFDDEGNAVLESGEIIVSDLYSVDRISPRELLMDIQCRNFPEKSEWIGHEIIKPLSYLKDNDLYKNTEHLQKNVELSETFERVLNKSMTEIEASRLLSDDEDKHLVRFVEIYDFKNGEMLVLPDDASFFIREEKNYLNTFAFLRFNEKPDSFFPISDIAQEKPIQQEINVGRSLQITHARRSARKYAYDQDTFQGVDDVEGIEAMKDPEDLTLVKVSSLDKKPEPIAAVAQDPSVFMSLTQSRIDFNRISSGTESQTGFTERRKTKGEAEFQEVHGSVRRTDKQSLVADFIVDIYTKLAKIMQDTLSVKQAIKISGNSGIFWTEVSKNDIQGEYYYDIEVAEMRPQIPELDRREISELIMLITNLMNAIIANPVGPMVFNIKGMVKEITKSYPNLDVENILNMAVTPEQIAEMVMQQIQGGAGQGEGGGQ
jgi:hypothetical protein